VHTANQVNLSYSRFLSDVSAHKVKTVDIQEATGQATGKPCPAGEHESPEQ
jgi:hypothetical protein